MYESAKQMIEGNGSKRSGGHTAILVNVFRKHLRLIEGQTIAHREAVVRMIVTCR